MMTRHRQRSYYICLLPVNVDPNSVLTTQNWGPSSYVVTSVPIILTSIRQASSKIALIYRCSHFFFDLSVFENHHNNNQQRQRVIMIISSETNILLKEYVLVSFVACIVIMFIARVSVWYCMCFLFVCLDRHRVLTQLSSLLAPSH